MTTAPQGIGLSPKERSILIWMCALIAANQLGFGAVVPVVALYAEEFGVTQMQVSRLLTRIFTKLREQLGSLDADDGVRQMTDDETESRSAIA